MSHRDKIEADIQVLKLQLTGDMFADMETKEKIHELEMKLNDVKPQCNDDVCLACGS
jgi:hypothetical protein